MNFNKRLVELVRREGWLLPLTILFGFLAGGLGVWQAFELSRVIADVFLYSQTLTQVIPILRIILVLVILRVALNFLTETLSGALAIKIKTRLRELLISKVSRLGPGYLKFTKSAELTTTAIQGVEALDAYFSQYLPQVLLAVMIPITILCIVFPIDLLTGVILLLTAPLIPLFMFLIGRLVEELTQKQWLSLTRLADFYLDSLQGIKTLKLFGRSKERGQMLDQVNESYRRVTLSVLRVTFITALVLELVATVSTAVVAVEIGLRLLHGRMAFQQAFFILLIAPDFYLPLRNLSARYHAGINGVTAAKRIFEILDMEESENMSLIEREDLTVNTAHGFIISFRDVSYTYPNRSLGSLKDINLELTSGRHYSLVGMSGSGKSTLVQLLLRFMHPETGCITLNEINIHDWEIGKWREFCGWVPQRPTLFNTSLMENITLGNNQFTLEEVDTALEKACLKDLVISLPKGLHTPMLETGSRLSGGQAQRVALARTFLRNPQFLFLDEPTAHLDPSLESSIMDSTRLLMDGKTTLTIAHRFSTILASDEIIVMADGRIVDHGSHDSLLQGCEVYKSLVIKAGDK